MQLSLPLTGRASNLPMDVIQLISLFTGICIIIIIIKIVVIIHRQLYGLKNSYLYSSSSILTTTPQNKCYALWGGNVWLNSPNKEFFVSCLQLPHILMEMVSQNSPSKEQVKHHAKLGVQILLWSFALVKRAGPKINLQSFSF